MGRERNAPPPLFHIQFQQCKDETNKQIVSDHRQPILKHTHGSVGKTILAYILDSATTLTNKGVGHWIFNTSLVCQLLVAFLRGELAALFCAKYI